MNHARKTAGRCGAPAVWALGLGLLALALAACQESVPVIAAAELDGEAAASTLPMGNDSLSWKEGFPAEYASFEAGRVDRASPSGYGGSLPVQKLDQSPELKLIYAGSPFSKDYKEDRNHVWAWQDLVESGRISDKTPASCLVCKTPDIAQIVAEQGWEFAKQPLKNFIAGEHPTISCATCHDPVTKQLRVIEPAFVDALAAQNIEWKTLSERQKSIDTCAQCHVEYYFEPGSNKVSLPLVKGTSPEAMYAYYQEKPAGFEKDFVHAVSGAAMIKVQHPDFEEWSDGIHAAAGLSCADCHMAKTVVNGEKTRNHLVGSPLHNTQENCLSCHQGKTDAWLKERVAYNQDRVASLQKTAGLGLAKAHELIGVAAKDPAADAGLISLARENVREAQFYWDYVASANSMGFHNPAKALSTLAKAQDLAYQARENAARSVGRVL